MKKQSSIQFLLEKLEGNIIEGNQLVLELIIDQAKEMHKQEIIDATLYGWRRSTEVNAILPNEFYNETFQNK